MFKTQYNSDNQSFNINIDNADIIFEFENLIPQSALYHMFDNIQTIIINNDFILSIFDKENYTEFVFLTNNPIDNNININFNNITTIDKISDTLVAINNSFYIITQDTTFGNIEQNKISLNLKNNEMRLLFSQSPFVASQSETNKQSTETTFNALTTPDDYIFQVPVGQPIPEFSISMYDDENYTTLRPLFNGNPVLSTISVDASKTDSTDEMGDLHFYNYGFGPSTRTSYIQVDCNIDVTRPGSFSLYMDAGSPTLRIYKISTGDLLLETVLTVDDDSNYRYKTNFTFSKEWGDGELLLIDIFLKMRIYNFLPITFSIGQSGTNETPLYNIFSTSSPI